MVSRINSATRVIAVKIPNINAVTSAWQNYVTTARQIEIDTGFTFFSTLSAPVASALRYKLDGQSAPTPTISSFSPGGGAVGGSVVITGANFGSALSVSFNGTAAAYSVDSAGQITAQVPANATSGHISVTTASGTATSSGTFNIQGNTLQAIQTVFVILMENHDWSEIKGSASAPYMNHTLLPMAAHAEQYFNPPNNHPSLPNYLWLEAGTNYGITDDADPASTIRAPPTIWSPISTRPAFPGPRTRRTSPAMSARSPRSTFTPPNIIRWCTSTMSPVRTAAVPPTASRTSVRSRNWLPTFRAISSPAYNFLTPNLCNDMHNSGCGTGDTIKNGDNWLATNLPVILNSPAYTNNGAIFIVWDESETGDGPIGMIVLSPLAKSGYPTPSTTRTARRCGRCRRFSTSVRSWAMPRTPPI